MLLAERIARFGNKIVSLLTAILIILLLTYGLYSLWDIYRINHNAFISDELLKYKPGQENGLGFDALREHRSPQLTKPPNFMGIDFSTMFHDWNH